MITVYTLLWFIVEHPNSITQLYQGIWFSSKTIGYIEQFFLYAAYSFSLMDLTNFWLHNGGFYRLIRKKQKTYLLYETLKKLFLTLCVIESMKVLTGFFLFITLKNISFSKIDYCFSATNFLFFESLFLLCLMQILFEWLFNSRTSLIIMWTFYFISLFIGDLCHRNGWPMNITLLLFPNLGMARRVTVLTFDPLFLIILLLTFQFFVIWILSRLLKRKDFF